MRAASIEYDLLVAGGGPAGTCAAIAAARQGLSTILVDENGCFGGMATAGLVNPFTPYWQWRPDGRLDKGAPSNAGIFAEILSQLEAHGALAEDGVTFNEEALKLVLDRLVAGSGATPLLHARVIDANVGVCGAGKTVMAWIATKSGLQGIRARYFIDATGDGDLASAAGLPFEQGRPGDGKTQPMTLSFRLGGVDASAFPSHIDPGKFQNNYAVGEMDARYLAMKKLGRIVRNPRDDLVALGHMLEGVMHFNSTRIPNLSGVDAEDLTAAELEGREQVHELHRFLKEAMPGFAGSTLLMTGSRVGVRETRRLKGAYALHEDDVLGAKKFPDGIARGTWHVELHDPDGPGTRVERIPPDDYYTIPYRCLYAPGFQNVLVAGRSISSTRAANSSSRVMPICASLGQAAGLAAALAAADGIPVEQVDTERLRKLIRESGGLC
jgi:hypothetical protein